MKRDRDETEEVRELFGELRREDEARTPSFAAVWEAAASRAGERRRAGRRGAAIRGAAIRGARIAAAAAIVLLVGSLFLFERHEPTRPAEVTASLASWQSPTSTLLTFSGGGAGAASWSQQATRRPRPRSLATTRWASPTASLLRSSAEPLLRSVPSLGRPAAGTEPRTTFN